MHVRQAPAGRLQAFAEGLSAKATGMPPVSHLLCPLSSKR